MGIRVDLTEPLRPHPGILAERRHGRAANPVADQALRFSRSACSAPTTRSTTSGSGIRTLR
jgi:hypothetical protein